MPAARQSHCPTAFLLVDSRERGNDVWEGSQRTLSSDALTFKRTRHHPFAVEKNHSFAVYEREHFGTIIWSIAKPGRTLNPSPSKARPGFPLASLSAGLLNGLTFPNPLSDLPQSYALDRVILSLLEDQTRPVSGRLDVLFEVGVVDLVPDA